MPKSYVQVNEFYIRALSDLTRCSPYFAKFALERREGIFEFAVEYLTRDNLDLPFHEKYPAFYAFTIMRRDYVESERN